MATGDEQQAMNEAADSIDPKDLAGLGRLTSDEAAPLTNVSRGT